MLGAHYTMFFKNYKHFHLLNYGQARRAIIVHTSESCNVVYTLNTRYAGIVERFDEYILEQSVYVRAVPELIVDEAGAVVEFFGKASSPFCKPIARQ